MFHILYLCFNHGQVHGGHGASGHVITQKTLVRDTGNAMINAVLDLLLTQGMSSLKVASNQFQLFNHTRTRIDLLRSDDPPLKCLDDGFQLFGTKCYKLITGNERNFEGAKSWCSDEADGAIVAEPRTNEEFHELLRLVQGHHRDRQ